MAKHYSLGVYDYDLQKLCDLYTSDYDLIGQAYDIKVTKDTNGYHTLEYSIPYVLDQKIVSADDMTGVYGNAVFGVHRFGNKTDKNGNSRNFRWHFLQNEYLIRYTRDDEEIWFLATKPVKSKSGKKITGNVTCNGYENLLKTRNIYKTFDDTNGIGTMRELMPKVLEGTGWEFDTAHSDILYERDSQVEKIRSLSSDGKQGALGLITTLCNLFQARPIFDTNPAHPSVAIKSINNRTQVFEGEVGKNLTAMTVNRDSTNIATRVYVEGEYGDYGYVGIDDVKVDANGNPDESGTAWGLPFLLNFDYYRQLGVFKQRHETALQTYLTAIRAKKAEIRAKAAELTECENAVNNMIGQCKVAIYYTPVHIATPDRTYGDMTDDQKTLHVNDDVIILKNNGTISYEEWLGQAYQTQDAYGVVKFVSPAAGRIAAAETQIEAKEKEITKLLRKINTYTNPDGTYIKPDKVAEYEAEIHRLQAEEDAIYVGETAYNDQSGYAVDDLCSHTTGTYGEHYSYLNARKFKCTTAIPQPDEGETHPWNASEWQVQSTFDGLFGMMHNVMKQDGLLYDLEEIQDEVDELNDEQDDIESDFIVAMGYMLRDGYWSNQNYIVGQEVFLYKDAQDMTKEMSKPTKDITFTYARLTEDYDVQPEEIEINAIFKLYDEELNVDDKMFVKKVSYGVDNKTLGSIEVSNQDITLTGNDLSTLLSRMSQLADLIEQKNALYERAKAISSNGSIYSDRLNGQIDVMKNQILSSVSNWYTDERGNMVFVSADESSAMMLSGAGFMLASGRDDNGNWDWRAFGDGRGFTAEEIVAGFISAERIEANSITVNKLASDVNTDLDLSSNTSINMKIETSLAYKLEIISTSDVLSKDITSTTLTAKVMKGTRDVTNDIPATRFNWKRHTNDAAADATWNSTHTGMKSISLGCSDVNYSATYECEVLSEGGS